jgi:hypothetical protein
MRAISQISSCDSLLMDPAVCSSTTYINLIVHETNLLGRKERNVRSLQRKEFLFLESVIFNVARGNLAFLLKFLDDRECGGRSGPILTFYIGCTGDGRPKF